MNIRTPFIGAMALLLFAEHAGSVEPLSTPELAEQVASGVSAVVTAELG